MEKNIQRPDSQNIYYSLLENAPTAIMVIRNGIVECVKGAVSTHTGYEEEELLARPFMEFIYIQDREIARHKFRELLEKKFPIYFWPFRILSRNGSIRWVEASAAAIEWHGDPAILLFLVDITPRKILEEELSRLMAEKP